VVSSELDGRQRGRWTPAKPSGESRARERVSLRETMQGRECGCGRCSKGSWGAWAGDVVRDLGVRACWSTAVSGEGRADRVVPWRSEGERVRGEMAQRANETGPRGKDRKGACGQGRLAPTHWPHWAEGGRARGGKETAADWWSPPVTQRGRARIALLGWIGPVWAEMGFLFFQGISIVFSFYCL
jgi:hypothetical protein